MDNVWNIIDMYKLCCCLDCGIWGVMGIGMGYVIGVSVIFGFLVVVIEGDSVFGFSGMEIEMICWYNLLVMIVIFNNGGIYRGDGVDFSGVGVLLLMDLLYYVRYDKLMDVFCGVGYNVIMIDEFCYVLIIGI